MHPDILSISEFFMELSSRALVARKVSGKEFWRLLTVARPAVRLALSPQCCPKEFLYEFGPGAAFDPQSLPPISYITLPHITDDPDGLIRELAPVLTQRRKAPVAHHYRFLFNWLRVRFGKKMWVERSGGSLIMTPALHAHFPQAKFIHIYRDGRDVALSISKHPPMRLLARNWNESRRFGINLLKPPFRLGDSRLLALMEPVLTPFLSIERQLSEPLELDIIGDYWSEAIRIGLANLAKIRRERVLNLCYETLVQNPERELSRLIQFIDPRLNNRAWLERAAGIPKASRSAWRDLAPPVRLKLERSCQPGMQLLGYVG